MLTTVLDMLASRGWFDTSTPFEKSIHLTQGACLWMLLSRGGVLHTYVKFSDCFDLSGEAARCEAAARCYPGLVPAHVGHGRDRGIDLLVARAAETTGIVPERFFDSPPPGLASYFAALPTATGPQGVEPFKHRALFEAMSAYFAEHGLAQIARRWMLDEALVTIEGLAAMPQHGDLVLNNLGLATDGALVIFDWEDFGTVSLPGFDLLTLELSVSGGAERWLARRAQEGGCPSWVVQACAAMSLPLTDYHRLAPLYALVFRYMKRNYGPEVRARMDREISALDRAMAP